MARLAAIPLRLDRASLSAFLLVVVCSNSGNYGLPVALLAFGREALTFASVYFVSSAIFSYTGGVLLAASGRRSIAPGARPASRACPRSTARWPRPASPGLRAPRARRDRAARWRS